MKNIFGNLPLILSDEITEMIASSGNVRIERIISKGQASPPDFWYDQEENEFVILLAGSAGISYEDGSEEHLKRGDYLIIPAHKKHRVTYTAKDETSIWLAVFY